MRDKPDSGSNSERKILLTEEAVKLAKSLDAGDWVRYVADDLLVSWEGKIVKKNLPAGLTLPIFRIKRTDGSTVISGIRGLTKIGKPEDSN